MNFLINGQGVFIFSNNIYKSSVLYFYNEDKTDGLKIKFTKQINTKISFQEKDKTERL